MIESRACEIRACVHVYTYWCSRHRQYCNTHEVTVSKTKGMEHGHGTKIIKILNLAHAVRVPSRSTSGMAAGGRDPRAQSTR